MAQSYRQNGKEKEDRVLLWGKNRIREIENGENFRFYAARDPQ